LAYHVGESSKRLGNSMTVSSVLSAWQRLKNREITCEEALSLLVDDSGNVKLELLDREVTNRFLREFPERNNLPALIPLLLWRSCYVKVIPINTKSYRDWFHTQKFDSNQITSGPMVDPATGQAEQENIGEVTELYLSKAEDQIGRIRTLISGALRNRASDIHLEPQPDGRLRVRYRIDGILRNITTLAEDVSRRAIVALKVMADMDIAESRRPQDARIGTKYAAGQNEDIGLDMRVSTLPCVGGEKAVIRLLPRENPFSKIDELGFSAKSLATYRDWLTQPQGMIILTGPTGSGKTSTLYTSLQTVATEEVNVVTVEDPVEYVLPQITQTQVHEAAGMTFAVGLRAILRQDPDIIMVGEIRDNETAETAIRAALTGHRVLTTLHTNDAVSAIPRLKDIGPDPGLISDALLGVVAQRLVRKICPNCAEPYTPTPSDLKVLGLTMDQAHPEAWRVGKGCSRCFNTGYLGREAVIELLDVDVRVRQLIYEGTTAQLHQYLQETDYPSFLKAAVEKVTTGSTTVQEVLRVLPHSSLYPRPILKSAAAIAPPVSKALIPVSLNP
jgi:type II secretory ATPase GspE/PulE/Tfp pilus assembly ATPase PilB-like protein